MSCSRGCCRSRAEHYRSIALAHKALARGNRADQALSRDLASYKALVDQGYEPHKMTGAYELARDAKTVNQIEGRPDVIDL